MTHPAQAPAGSARRDISEEVAPMFATVAVVLVILWALGFGIFHVAGSLIHLLLIFALIAVIYHVTTGRRASV